MKTNELTPQEIESLRIAIAEECGRCTHGPKDWEREGPEGDIELVCKICRTTEITPPPYTTSLDAIQAAAMERFVDSFNKGDFEVNLTLAANECSCIWQLTALDWCIAFARTAKIWRFKQ